ncbi:MULTISPECIES: hypothetical protein [unclassified Microbacterium]|uniref:hypothetical protein n=1 Tax=unclassified Microbacterium TaxID=2609290 RepID=UPI000493603A|nr:MULTISPECIES: hypothetical protein [unclassified Microbacterium]
MNERPAESSTRRTIEQIVAGLVIVLVGPTLTWFIGKLADADLPVGWYFGGIVVVALFATVIYGPWRRVIWGSIALWRPLTTKRTLEKAHAHGRAELQSELDAEAEQNRHRPLIRPQWLILPGSERYEWVLFNAAEGSTAEHVSITPGSGFFAGSALDWDSVHGGEKGIFRGRRNEQGQTFGVRFSVEWTDIYGERQPATVDIAGEEAF